MSRKIFGDTDYYTTKELFEYKAKDGKHYDYEVNKVTNDLIPSNTFLTVYTQKEPFEVWINWHGTYYFELPLDNGFDWQTFITYTRDLDVADRRCALFALFAAKNEHSEKWTYRFYDGKIYFLRDDFFAIEDYMDIDLPVEDLPGDYTKSVVSTLLTILADNGTQKNNIRKNDLKYLYVDHFPEITRKIYSYNRTWDGWFGYILQPNFKDRFLSYDDYLKSDGTVIKTVRISEWEWNTKKQEVQEACQALQDEYDSDNLEHVYEYNKLVYDCLVTAGYLEIKDDINRIYANTDWCLRNDLANMINKLEVFQFCIDTINAETGEHNRGMKTKLIKYIADILSSFALKFDKLKQDIMVTGVPVYWYPNVQNVSSRSEYWKSLYDLFNFGLTTLAVDFGTYFNNGYKWLYGPMIDGLYTNLVIIKIDPSEEQGEGNHLEISHSEDNEYIVNSYIIDGTQMIPSKKIVTSRLIETDYLGNEYTFNIQQFFYYLMEHYYRREFDPGDISAYDYRPLDIYAAAFELVPAINENDILAFLQGDIQTIGQFIFNEEYFYTTQEALRKYLKEFYYTVPDISYFERIWEIFTLPDTINRYAVSKCKISRSFQNTIRQSIMDYTFIPGQTVDNILDRSYVFVELYLSRFPITDENYNTLLDNNLLMLIAPSTHYSELQQDENHRPWILKDHVLTNNTRETVDLVGGGYQEKLYKVYMFVFKNIVTEEIVRFPRLEFDFSGVPYTVAPEIPDMQNIDQEAYLDYINAIDNLEYQMALIFKTTCEKCTNVIKVMTNGYTGFTIYQLECYDQEELQKFYNTFSVFFEFETALETSLETLSQNTWFQDAINTLDIDDKKNAYVKRLTRGRMQLSEGALTPTSTITELESDFHVIVKRLDSEYVDYPTYSFYNTGTFERPNFLSPKIQDSQNKYQYWYNMNALLDDFMEGLPPYISDIRIYKKVPRYFTYTYACKRSDSPVPNIIMSHYKQEDNEALNDYVTSSGFSEVTTFSIE